MIQLDKPAVVRMNADGTVAKEVIREKNPITCPACNGSGYIFGEEGHGGLRKCQCDACLGYGSLNAEITIVWKPCIQK